MVLNSEAEKFRTSFRLKEESMRRRNFIGSMIIKLRFEQGWSQEILAARLQCRGVNINRQILANMECGRTVIPAELLGELQKVFRKRIIRFFPSEIQERDEKFGELEKMRPFNPALTSASKPRHRKP